MHTSPAASDRRTGLGRWIVMLCLAVLPLANAAAVDSQPESALHITQAQLLSVPGTGYSAPPRQIE